MRQPVGTHMVKSQHVMFVTTNLNGRGSMRSSRSGDQMWDLLKACNFDDVNKSLMHHLYGKPDSLGRRNMLCR